jgi:hypothetical protein
MLAYVFWHWQAANVVAPEAYEAAQRRFHAKLSEVRPEGFLRSWSYAVLAVPWLPVAAAYEDWYLLDGSHGLDTLNDAAVSASMRESHDAAATGASGLGGLYGLQAGSPGPRIVPARWFAKPAGESYQQLYDRLPPAAALWRRQLVLGPAPEFLFEDGGQLPAGIATTEIVRRLLQTGEHERSSG